MKSNRIIYFLLGFFLLIFIIEVKHSYALKRDLPLKVNFLVAKVKDRGNAYCDVYDKHENLFPVRSYSFYRDHVYVDDSIVKKSNSNLIYIYRKRNWKDYSSDDSYYVAEKIEYDK